MEQITAPEVHKQLKEILNSADFQASQRLKNFLKYIVEAVLNGKSADIKAYTIAVDVFGLSENFDPRTNPLVRTEAGRLRSKLDHYYLLHPESKIHISIPKGAYTPAFSRISEAATNQSQLEESNLAYSFTPQSVLQPEYKATILVLPLTNINNTEEVEQFIAGLVNEIIIDLTKFRELRVVDYSRLLQMNNITANQKQNTTDPKARFVLSGSVQFENNIFKIWVELVDTTTNYNIWGDKFDATLDESSIFELQESIAKLIVYRIADDFGLLQRTLLKEFASGASTSSILQEASLLYYHWTTVLTKNEFKKALESVEKALKSDPGHIPTQAMLADLYASNYQWSYGLVENSLEKSLQIATKAINLDPECQLAHLAMSINYYLRGDKEKFILSAERAIEINPSSTNVLSAIASWYGLCGMWEKALELTNEVLDANPNAPGWCHSTLAMYYFMRRDFTSSLAAAKKIHMPDSLWDPLLRLASGGFLGEREECDQAIAELIAIYPDFLSRGFHYLDKNLPNKVFLNLVYDGLARAGVVLPRPDETNEDKIS